MFLLPVYVTFCGYWGKSIRLTNATLTHFNSSLRIVLKTVDRWVERCLWYGWACSAKNLNFTHPPSPPGRDDQFQAWRVNRRQPSCFFFLLLSIVIMFFKYKIWYLFSTVSASRWNIYALLLRRLEQCKQKRNTQLNEYTGSSPWARIVVVLILRHN